MSQQTLDERAFHAGWRAGVKACMPTLGKESDREALAKRWVRRYVKCVAHRHPLTERQIVLLTYYYGGAFLDALEGQLDERYGLRMPVTRASWI